MPEDMPDRMPEDLPDRMPEDIKDMPEDLPDRMPEDVPEDMPEHMPEDMPDRMPEDMSYRMPEDLPVRKSINVMVGITRSKELFSNSPPFLYYTIITILLSILPSFCVWNGLAGMIPHTGTWKFVHGPSKGRRSCCCSCWCCFEGPCVCITTSVFSSEKL